MKIYEDFFNFQAQTSPHPMGLEVSSAKSSYIYGSDGKAYLDFVAGVSACPLGHCHPRIVKAIQQQTQRYMHVMVYGEFITSPAVRLCRKLSDILPAPLKMTYLVNSGTEAIEGAIKLAKRATERTEIIAAEKAYHGNTQGSMSLMGSQRQKIPFCPIIPNTRFIRFNSESDIAYISEETAAVILETIQGSAGFIVPRANYLQKVKKRCKEVGALLILDEIQSGFGRTGSMFAFQDYGIVPDILVMGKGMANGMPIGAFTASKDLMLLLSDNPKLGHITTFGGHPVIASAALATLDELAYANVMKDVSKKEKFIKIQLKHPDIKQIKGKGLMLALEMKSKEIANRLVLKGLERGLILFWLLFDSRAVRITPPLTISMRELAEGIDVIKSILEEDTN